MTTTEALLRELARQLGRLYDEKDVNRAIAVRLLPKLEKETPKPAL